MPILFTDICLFLVSVVPVVLSLLIEKSIAVVCKYISIRLNYSYHSFLCSKLVLYEMLQRMVSHNVGNIMHTTNILFVVALPVIVLQLKGDDFSFGNYIFTIKFIHKANL